MDTHTVRRALAGALPNQSGKIVNAEDYLQAAVTIPLIEIAGQPSILFEVRSGKLNWQPGDICFPGGRIENRDSSPLEAAVRETVEELGVKKGDIAALGALDLLVSPIGVILYPYVVHITTDVALVPNMDEVAEVFTVPLDFLLAAKPQTAFMETATKPLDGFPFELLPPAYPRGYRGRAKYPVLFYQYNHYVIWGVTARVLAAFIGICQNRMSGYPLL
ncbi:CoA pyrophosphatase [Sporomusa sp. KB1]|jgi:8-oxo-dGTP pyrophosphatase MutT (NUDIX family)|uniref:NUDIX hydrolase n=1 Tax=Sporomusa sp. KB1 TaxID=943346 RepID=UPI00119FC409|nr:CoA pyrophosphatase [Sporomusa sp. KB1]